MKKMKLKNALITKEDRELIFNSNFIKEYPLLKELLQKKIKVYSKDIEYLKNIDIEMYNKILYASQEFRDKASREWYKYKYDGKYKAKCTLCNRDNTYIYLIKNRINNTIMNVGSECIDKFPHLEGLIDGKDIKQHKKEEVAYHAKIRRIAEFNNMFPYADKVIEKWKNEYENLEILMPEEIDTSFKSLLKNSKDFYDRYINGKLSKSILAEFEKYIKQHDIIMIKCQNFIDENRDWRNVCHYEIKKWLVAQNLQGIIRQIILDGGFIKSNIVKYIYCLEFVERYMDDFEEHFQEYDIFIKKYNKDTIELVIKYNREEITLETTLKSLMLNFIPTLYKKNKLNSIGVIEILDICKSEYQRYENILNDIMKNSGYKFNFKYDRDEAEIINEKESRYATVRLGSLINKSKKILMMTSEEGMKVISGLLLGIKKWRDKKDKEKYNLNEIERIMKKRIMS